ncbi:Lar family restriction alleviation protein [Thioclava sp. DLFJ4-1]|uniref:Lar family restriction alleviation protein n=1 Tax=Thioclava sp. DLFJ4-1 TaxID=1915313 RepID=UPI000997DD15|nr:Lar family restriction alleviation protein [Thioclava sp. DLFJ4-1]OOY15107.1 hypothetical protein BMI85_16300 [Thioclava sp. DLFJ4-1]
MSAPELLPCPFCGGPAELWQAQDNRPAWIACMGRCVVLISKEHATNEDAIKTWNTRAILSDPRVKAMQSELELLREYYAAHEAIRKVGILNASYESLQRQGNARAALAALQEAKDD